MPQCKLKKKNVIGSIDQFPDTMFKLIKRSNV